jgi:hypothetical protein
MNEQIKKGADIHAGDGGYSIGTQERYEQFAKERNRVVNERIQEFILQCTDTIPVVNEDSGITHHREFFDYEKFAELIIQECIDYCGENLSKTVGGALKIHFGVKE